MQPTDAHHCYNPQGYPHFIAHCANWHIMVDASGRAAAVAVKPGCKSSHYGDLNHVRRVLETTAAPGRRRAIAARLAVIERRMTSSNPA